MIDTQAIRSKILDLAMRGQLTEQLPEDGTAEELYQQIQAEKQKLINAGKIKKEKPLPEIAAEEIPFEIPQKWRWARLADITTNLTLNDGDWVLSDDMDENGTVKLIQLGSIGDLQYRDKGFKHLTTERFETLNAKQIYPGFLLINRMVADKMLLCILPEIEGVLITAVDVCWVAPQKEYYDIKFLMYALASSGTQQKVKDVGYGVTRFRISKTNLIGVPFPFPPLAEQHRIVARIEQAFSALDTIDALQAKYADNLAVLKSKLIDAAIQGKLTEQLPEDGTAEELYRQIQAGKQALIKSGKIKKEKPLPEITADEIPFEIPENWKWVRLGDISESVNVGIVIRPKRYYVPQEQGTPAFRNCNIQQGFIDDGEWVYLNANAAKENPRAVVKNGDILVARSGTPGNCCVVTEAYSGRGAVDIVIVRLRQKLAVPDFIQDFLCSTFSQKAFLTMSRGVALSHLGATTVASLTVPLPPLAEQKRIVDRITKLLAVCDEFKCRMRKAESYS